MKFILVFFLFTSLFYSQNKYKEISNKRIEISKFVFDEVLDPNTFNSSIVTKIIFKNHNFTIYSIKTYSPHALLNISVFCRKKMKLFRIEKEENINEVLLFLKQKSISEDILQKVNKEIRKIPL
jgi:hypothetical protein